jgi:hypothetical protein
VLLLYRADVTESLGHLRSGLLGEVHRLQERLSAATSMSSVAQLLCATVGVHARVGMAPPRASSVSRNQLSGVYPNRCRYYGATSGERHQCGDVLNPNNALRAYRPHRRNPYHDQQCIETYFPYHGSRPFPLLNRRSGIRDPSLSVAWFDVSTAWSRPFCLLPVAERLRCSP